MELNNKIQYLIVDTSAFIKNTSLQEIGVNIITEEAVVNEITNKRQLRRLGVLPYDLKVQSAFPENIKFVTEFAKKTGDYASLSATDVKLIALTYQLEKEKVGTKHLKEVPTIVKTISGAKHNKNYTKPIVGFYMPKKKSKRTKETKDKKNVVECEKEMYVKSLLMNDVEKNENVEQNEKNKTNESIEQDEKNKTNENVEQDEKNKTNDSVEQDEKNKNNEKGQEDVYNKNKEEHCVFEEDRLSSDATRSSDDDYVSDNETAMFDLNNDADIETENLADKFANLNCEPTQLEIQSQDGNTHNVDDILATIPDEEDEDLLEEANESEDDCNNDSDWITPNNIKNVRQQMNSDVLKEKSATVACLTTDFAMQNVLMQIGLNVSSLDGKVIKQMRTFIFRCYACFKTTSIMTKVFCPNCGNKTLKKVAISLDDNGKQQIHINTRRPLTARGKKYSLPTPQGGKHANNPILCEDQPMPQQRISKLARKTNNPLCDDYIAGYSPFITRDVYSKSAELHIRSNGGVKYWMKKNPNECNKKRK